jgi:tetratricopeptide (TPR) repeat protein/ADP-heptose:LPS heptosyltransferase
MTPDIFQQATEHHRSGRLAEAELLYRQLLAQNPNHADALNQLGYLLYQTGRYEPALENLQRAVELNPLAAEFHNNLGLALVALKRGEEAVAAYEKAIDLQRDLPEIHYNLANAYVSLQRWDEAETSLRQALQIRSDLPDGWTVLGNILTRRGDLPQAIAALRTALEKNPQSAAAHFNLSCGLLKAGRLVEGWTHYEWRDRKSVGLSNLALPQPLWKGEDLRGKTILLYTEQAFGDAFQFVRFAPVVARLGAKILLGCRAELARIFASVADTQAVIVSGQSLPDFDLHCSLLSVPGILNTSLETIPASVPYLRAEAPAAARWRELLAKESGFKIGLVWGGSKQPDPDRSIPLSEFADLGQIPGVRFVSLQKGPAAEEARHPPPGLSLTDWTADLHDFADTAALISQLDLVIAVDTSVAHLAGAMGKPVWVLLQNVSDWRWLEGRDDSPWYPTMRLFRQPVQGDWKTPLRRIQAQLYSMVGASLYQANRLPEALQAMRGAAAANPKSWEYHSNIGLILTAMDRFDEAAEALRHGLAAEPKSAPLHFNLGVALRRRGNVPEAIAEYRQAIALQPNEPQYHQNLATSLAHEGDTPAAAAEFEKAIALRPDFADALYGLANAQMTMEQPEAAVIVLQKAVQLTPSDAEGWHTLSDALRRAGRCTEAIVAAEKAVALNPDYHLAHNHLGVLYLLTGDFRRGWSHCEHRLKLQSPGVFRPTFTQPAWDGGNLHGKRILLYPEGGFGDTIQFSRYAPLVAQRGGKVILGCGPALARLFQTISGVTELAVSGVHVPDFDVQCPMMTLPMLLDTTLENVPADVPYVHADPRAAEQWRRRLPAERVLKIGLVWAGNPKMSNDHIRSIPLRRFAHLAKIPNVWFCSLQKGPAGQQVAGAKEMQLADFTAELNDFADTAALVANLDLVIAVDTAVAHLAGALGRPIWMLTRFAPDWRWVLDRDDSPWYPTMRLFRQTRSGEWDDPIDRLTAALRKRAAD